MSKNKWTGLSRTAAYEKLITLKKYLLSSAVRKTQIQLLDQLLICCGLSMKCPQCAHASEDLVLS